MNEPSRIRINPHQLSPPTTPRQFGMIDLFALLTLAALVFAMTAPFIRVMPTVNRNKLFILAIGQLLVAVVAFVVSVQGRKSLLKRSGQRVEIGYLGAIRWRHWPVFRSVAFMILLAVVQLSLVFSFAMSPNREMDWTNVFVNSVQLSYFTGYGVSRYLWRVYPGAIEFFENGISFAGTKFIGWDRVEARPGQYTSDRVVLFLRQGTGSVAGMTIVTQVSESLRDQLLQHS